MKTDLLKVTQLLPLLALTSIHLASPGLRADPSPAYLNSSTLYFQNYDRSVIRKMSMYKTSDITEKFDRIDKLQMVGDKWKWVRLLETKHFTNTSPIINAIVAVDENTLLVGSHNFSQSIFDSEKPDRLVTLVNLEGEVLDEVHLPKMNFVAAIEGNVGDGNDIDIQTDVAGNIFANTIADSGSCSGIILKVVNNKIQQQAASTCLPRDLSLQVPKTKVLPYGPSTITVETLPFMYPSTNLIRKTPYLIGEQAEERISTSDVDLFKQNWQFSDWWKAVNNAQQKAISITANTTLISDFNAATACVEVKYANGYELVQVGSAPPYAIPKIKLLAQVPFRSVVGKTALFGLANGDVFWARGLASDVDSDPLVFLAKDLMK